MLTVGMCREGLHQRDEYDVPHLTAVCSDKVGNSVTIHIDVLQDGRSGE